MKVTREHFRTCPGFSAKPGFCARGGRRWFARHGLSWTDFVRQGIDAEQLLRTGDGMAAALVAHARATGDAHGR